MQPVVTAAQSAEADALATDSVETLMDRAGLAVAISAAQEGAGYGFRVQVLAGPGNNGGDGYIAAKYLQRRGATVEVIALAEPKSAGAVWAMGEAERAGVPINGWRAPEENQPPDLVVDALFGSGFRGELPSEAKSWTDVTAPVVAVDIPSGLDTDTGVAEGSVFGAVRTVTFGSLKVGHLLGSGPELSGEVTVADIGLPDGPYEFLLCEEGDAPRPGRPRTGHKWSVGSVLLVGGSPGISGALVLAARSALNAGAGAVKMAIPSSLESTVEEPELMTVSIGTGDRFTSDDAAEVLEAAQRFDVVALGPGLGAGQTAFVSRLVDQCPRPLIIDADGLNALDGIGMVTSRGPETILTPHAGEFRRLAETDATYEAASLLAREVHAVIVLKGAPTFVAGEALWAVTSGGSELATVGTGDVLTGMVAAFRARGLDSETAARSAAYWHGRAGAAARQAGTVTADVLAEEVGSWAW